MQVIITAYDGENKLDKRMDVRPRHLSNLNSVKGKLLCAGGLLDDTGKMKGSVLVMEFEEQKDLDDYLSNEPYIVEHVWETVEIEKMNVVILDGKKVGK